MNMEKLATWAHLVLEALGGAVAVLGLLLHGVQPLFLRLTPYAVAATRAGMAWLISLPWLGDTIIANRAQFKALFDAIAAGGKALLDAMDAEADKDIDAAQASKAPSPMPMILPPPDAPPTASSATPAK